MEALHFVLFAFAILNISSIALSLRCQKCGSYGEECSDDANVTIVDCDGFEDRCMTIITTTMITQNAEPPTKVMKDCAHSKMICQEQGPGYPCKEVPFGGSCNIECCDGDLCNQASSEAGNTTSYNVTNSGVVASSLTCEVCGPDRNPCGGDIVASVDCGEFADRCMTVSMTIGPITTVMKNCANSNFTCQEQGGGNPCKHASSFGGSCNMECCEGDMCNQASSEAGNTTAHNVTNPGVELSNSTNVAIRCYQCQPNVTNIGSAIAASGGASLGGVDLCNNPTDTVDCSQDPNIGSFADACYSASVTVNISLLNFGEVTYHVQGCAAKSMCPRLKKATCDTLKTTFAEIPGFGISNCDISCCEGDLCNNPSVSPTTASSLKCEACGPDGEPCGGDNVTSVECGGFADRCMTVTVTRGSNTMTMKNCANSTVHCREQSEYNPCKQAASLGGSCNFECCEGDMCNQYNTTAGNSTKAEVAASSLKCQKCGPMDDPCDEANVTSFECGGSADRCLTVSMEMGNTTMLVKNCGYSTLNCQNDSQYNPCKVAPIGASCNIRCCEGDMCNLASPSTTAAPSTTVSSPPTTPGIEPPPAVVKGRFFKVNSSPVCFGSKNNEFGRFSVPSTGDLAAIKLVHLYGYVACYSRAKWSIWGCGGPKVNVVITTSANDVILPPAEFSDAGHWSIIPGYTSISPELVLSVFSRPRPVTSGEEFHLWYGEDFVDDREGDNRGTVCSDVYVLFF